MQTRSRSTRGSVLGKRAHCSDPSSSSTAAPVSSASTATTGTCEPPTPDATPNPKRARISLTAFEGDWNKENVAPLRNDAGDLVSSPSTARALRRTSTEFVTPSRPRMSARRHASTSNILSSEIDHLALSTPPPTPPTSLLPLHARARACLRATCNGNSNSAQSQIAGRVDEREAVRVFVTAFLRGSEEGEGMEEVGEGATTLYISGAPGTGKTALVHAVLAEFEAEARVRVVTVNCMALGSVDALWDRLLEELGDGGKGKGKKGVGRKGREGVVKALEGVSAQCILILDELDHIASSLAALTALFTLPTPRATLRIIGIANTHTLSSNPITSPLTVSGVQTLHFAPYSSAQLLDILNARLLPLFSPSPSEKGKEHAENAEARKFLPVPTLTLLVKKIAAQTGDVRALFEVLRGAIDLAASSASSSSINDNDTLPGSGTSSSANSGAEHNPLNTPTPSVSPAHILAALRAHAPSSSLPARSGSGSRSGVHSETATKVRSLGLQAQLALLAVLLASKRLEVGLSLSSSPAASLASSTTSTPTKPKSPTKPRSPTKRTASTFSTLSGSSGAGAGGIETGALHAYYTAVLTRAPHAVFAPVSRSEFGDVLGMLEVVGLVSLSLASSSGSASPCSPSKRAFARSSSFGGGVGKGRAGGCGAVGVAEGVRAEELLRGLGVDVVAAEGEKNVREEEVCAIWERERVRLVKDLKALERARGKVAGGGKGDMFVDAMED